MRRLGLSGPEGERVYNLLYVSGLILYETSGLTSRLFQNEAMAGRDRLSRNYDALTAYSKMNRVLMPYRWDDLQETYRHHERLNIVRLGCRDTQPYYQAGQWGSSVVQDNWVADWFLWHSFRFRDNRNPTVAQRAAMAAAANQQSNNSQGSGSSSGGRLLVPSVQTGDS